MAKDCRLQKFIAECGLASRRKAEEMISEGRVTVNGRKATIGDKIDRKVDLVKVDGERLAMSDKKWYLMINKPRGYVTTMSDEKGRKCVADLVSDIPERVYPVGRLDRESEGMLIMTNDGEFSNLISHPSGHIPKLYRVTVRPNPTEDMLVQMSVGMVIDGVKTAPCTVRVLTEEPERTVLEIVLNEGRNRQIRKMCEHFGLEVLRLKRNAIGPVKLGMLQLGEYRELSKEEILALKNYAAKIRNKTKSNNERNKKPQNGKKPVSKTARPKRNFSRNK